MVHEAPFPFLVRQPDPRDAELDATGHPIELIQPVICGAPDCAGSIFRQRVHAPGFRLLVRRPGDEHRFAGGGCPWIESGDAAIARDPVDAVPGLQQIVHPGMRQPVPGRVVRELVAVKTGEPFVGAEPQKPAGVLPDGVDMVVRQALGGGVCPERQLLGRRSGRQAKKCNRRLHIRPHQGRTNRVYLIVADLVQK